MVVLMRKTKTVEQTAWENEGKFLDFMYEEIPSKYWDVYIWIIRNSIGYLKSKTKRINSKEIAKQIGIGKDTFYKKIKWLEENGFIKIVKSKGYIEGGGSLPNAYSPIFPYKYNKDKYNYTIVLKDIQEKKEDITNKRHLL